jgi:protein-S-isoprenylcysteine O-methyltransferase Ste14
MVESLAKIIISASWGVFIVVWMLAALFAKRTVYRESAARRLRYILPILLGWFLIFRGYRLGTPFNNDLLPETDAILAAAAILCVCGLGLCLWARAVLGRNWSGTVTLKENHELIVRGPYRLVRHPIYTALMAMLIATWMEQSHIAGMIGLLLTFISFWIKLGQEEEVMQQQFPKQYPAYQLRTKRIVPFIL